MPPLLRAFAALWRVSLATMIQYRGEVALWALWGIIYPCVAMAMWGAAAGGDGGGVAGGGDGAGQRFGGFGPREFAAYFLLTMVVGHFCTAWDLFEFGHVVRSGALSPRLLRPILPLWSSLADNLAFKVVTLSVVGPLWIMIAWLAQPAFATRPIDVLLGVPALLIGAALNYLLGYTLSLVAFWTTRTDAVGEFWFGASMLFGGRMAPLALLPGVLQWMTLAMPFRWIINFPATALMGRLSVAEMLTGLACQLVWLAIGLVAFRVLWREGLKRYSAVGA